MKRLIYIPILICSLLVYRCNEPVQKEPLTIVSNGDTIAWNSCGTGDTTLLFVHGWCINKEYWEPQLNYFCPQYKVVAIDLPGFGQSGKSRSNWSFDAYAQDIKTVIERLELKNVILIGHSMSGDLLLKVDTKYPGLLTGIVGVDNLHQPGTPLTPEQQQETEAFFSALTESFDSTVVKYMIPELFQLSTPAPVISRVRNDVLAADSLIATGVLRSMVDISQQEQQLMKMLSHRLYLVNSDITPVVADSLEKYCNKGFKVFPVHATGHYPMIEKPADFNTALQQVITDISAGN